MGAEHLEVLGIAPEQVATEIDFLEAYADASIRELEGSDDAEERWTIAVDAASALREAGQWALALDPRRAYGLLDRAGDLFYETGHAFGAYLKVVAGSWSVDPPLRLFMRDLQALDTLHAGPGPAAEDAGQEAAREVPPALLHPQQQAYLAISAAASGPVVREFGPLLSDILERSPQRLGVAPVGALGMPVRTFWSIAQALVGDGGLDEIAAAMTSMAQRYSESATLASTNAYTWRSGAAPFDVGDLDLASFAVIGARHFGQDSVADALEARSHESRWAFVPIGLAMEFARADFTRGE